MGFAMLLSTLLIGYPLIFMPSYISEGSSFPKQLSSKDEQLYLSLLSDEKEGKNAKEMLIKHNMRLVAHIAKKYTNTGTEPDDLISIGTVGLIKAIDSYSVSRNVRLGTYAARCIENEILMWIRKCKKEKAEVSINEPLGTDREGNEISFNDILGTDGEAVEDDFERKMEIAHLMKAIESKLKPREQQIIIRRFGLFGNDEL
ncbi:MAG: sigma-70 family RNA polymerase sigma factor, partial [Firmicutes bacterium]|nr:sigma-70 family RNA polymerase sigma factor [Bacillota bacterium]